MQRERCDKKTKSINISATQIIDSELSQLSHTDPGRINTVLAAHNLLDFKEQRALKCDCVQQTNNSSEKIRLQLGLIELNNVKVLRNLIRFMLSHQ